MPGSQRRALSAHSSCSCSSGAGRAHAPGCATCPGKRSSPWQRASAWWRFISATCSSTTPISSACCPLFCWSSARALATRPPATRVLVVTVAWSFAMLVLLSAWMRGDYNRQQAQWASADRLVASGTPPRCIGATRHWSEYHGAFDDWLAAKYPRLRPPARRSLSRSTGPDARSLLRLDGSPVMGCHVSVDFGVRRGPGSRLEGRRRRAVPQCHVRASVDFRCCSGKRRSLPRRSHVLRLRSRRDASERGARLNGSASLPGRRRARCASPRRSAPGRRESAAFSGLRPPARRGRSPATARRWGPRWATSSDE